MEKKGFNKHLSVQKQKGYVRGFSYRSGVDQLDDDVFYPLDKLGSWSNLNRFPRFSRQTSRQTSSRRHSNLPTLSFQSFTKALPSADASNSCHMSYVTCDTIFPAKVIPMENTFKLDPDRVFPTEKATQMMKEILSDNLQGKAYSAAMGATMSKLLADEIKEKVQFLNIPRYKIVANVTIGQLPSYGIVIGSECLSDRQRDKSATASFQGKEFFATGTVYAFYFE